MCGRYGALKTAFYGIFDDFFDIVFQQRFYKSIQFKNFPSLFLCEFQTYILNSRGLSFNVHPIESKQNFQTIDFAFFKRKGNSSFVHFQVESQSSFWGQKLQLLQQQEPDSSGNVTQDISIRMDFRCNAQEMS